VWQQWQADNNWECLRMSEAEVHLGLPVGWHVTASDIFTSLLSNCLAALRQWRGSYSVKEKLLIVLVYVLSKTTYLEQLVNPPPRFDSQLQMACVRFVFSLSICKYEILCRGKEIGLHLSLPHLGARRLAMRCRLCLNLPSRLPYRKIVHRAPCLPHKARIRRLSVMWGISWGCRLRPS